MRRLLTGIFLVGLIGSIPLATGSCTLDINSPRVTNDSTFRDGGGGPGSPTN